MVPGKLNIKRHSVQMALLARNMVSRIPKVPVEAANDLTGCCCVSHRGRCWAATAPTPTWTRRRRRSACVAASTSTPSAFSSNHINKRVWLGVSVDELSSCFRTHRFGGSQYMLKQPHQDPPVSPVGCSFQWNARADRRRVGQHHSCARLFAERADWVARAGKCVSCQAQRVPQ